MSDEATDLGAAGFGLMFYNARWYDPTLGRFAQADSIVPGGVQGLDRYAYVNNSPVRFTDPSGHRACGDGEEIDCDGKLKQAKHTLKGCGEFTSTDCAGNPWPKPDQPKSWSFDLSYGFHIGGTAVNVPDQSSDDFLNGAESTACLSADPRIGALCFISLLGRFAFVGPQVTDPNFFITLTVTYDTSGNITITNLTIINLTGSAIYILGMKFEDGKKSVEGYGSITIPNGLNVFNSNVHLPDPPAFSGNGPLTITLEYELTVNTGSAVNPGPSNLYPEIIIQLPSSPSFLYFVQTGQPLPEPYIP